MPRQYAAFISYRHRPLDIAVAEKIHKSIERFKIPRDLRLEEKKAPGSVFTSWEGQPFEGNLLVFRDREELPLSNDLTADIFEALDHTKCLIVICTPDTPKSLWVRREISYFIEKHGRNRIVTVLAAGTPEESIPKEITTVYAEDGITVLEEYEPLVAYLTADSRKKVLKNLDKELLRLCAAILGCPYDSLRQRHKRRKMRQTMAAISAALLVAMSFIGMLINRNLEIEAQKRSVQLRESELLAADAEEALLTGNTLRAVESAVSALPKEGEEDRPYYAPAESILMEAMDILGGADAPVLLREITLEQMTPIVQFCLSPDGVLAVTIDDYGVIHCFDTASGEECWTDVLITSALGGAGKFVSFSEDGTLLFCNYDGLMECRESVNGKVRWSQQLEFSSDEYYIYDPLQNRLALIRDCFRAEAAANCLEMTLLDAETGETLSHMTLDQSDSGISYSLINISCTRMPENGAFSEDGRYLACAFPQQEKGKEVAGLACFVVDLKEMQVVLEYHQDLPDNKLYQVTAMDLRDEHVYLSLESNEDTIAGTIMKLNWRSGELLWSTTTPAELENSVFSLDQTSSVLFWDTAAFLGRYEKIYAVDLSTGQVLGSVQLPSTLNYMYTVSNRYFGYSLADGTYAIGWFHPDNGFTLSSDPFYQVTADIGPHTLMRPYRGGIVQLYTDGTYFELSVSNIEREGYLAYIGNHTRNALTISRPITVEKPLEQTVIRLPVEQSRIYCNNPSPVFCTNNTMILGSFSVDLEDGNSRVFYAAIDRATHQVTELFDVEYSYNMQVDFLPDGSGYLRHAEGSTWLHKNGQSVLLGETKKPDIWSDYYHAEILTATDTVRLTDGNLMTACCDPDSLVLMTNGEPYADIPFPPEHCYDYAPDELRYRKVFAGKNGAVLTICHSYDPPFPSDSFVLYQPESGWIKLAEPFTLSNTNALAFSAQNHLMALADDSNQIRLFDLTAGTQTAAFPLQLPSRSVLFMDFILDDTCLLLKTKDAQILIIELATGEICFHDKLGSTYNGILHSYVDKQNQRLYIIDSNYTARPNCLCVDLHSWTTLGTGTRILCFDESSGELIHFDNHYDTQDSLSCLRIPGTRELVQLGQQMLAAR